MMKPIELREAVKWFAEAMERELRENDHKGGWRECDLEWLLQRLEDEKRELVSAVLTGNFVLSEAADVANFAMMIADVWRMQHETN